MHLPRVRFTIRRLMIAVAVVAVMIRADEMRRRWTTFSAKGAEYRQRAGFLWSKANALATISPDDLDQPPRILELSEYYRDLAEKYERAAARPWLTVAPDPPEPE
jgi:hypothetical protein